ncbi:MAG TPA: extracellular solute-binding protein [Lachnospiraceae bacterium]|nr:extracellular solute-binding protein [Lachnospiraceae bacterium]
MKKSCKKIISIVLAAVMTLGLAACGDNKQNRGNGNVVSNADAKKYVYKMSDVNTDFITESMSVYNTYYKDGRIYLLTYENRYDEKTGMVINLVSVKEDGSDVQTINLFDTLRDNPDYFPEDGNYEKKGPDVTLDNTGDEATTDEATTDEATTDEATNDVITIPENNATEGDVIHDVWLNSNKIDNNGVFMVMESNSYRYDTDGNYIDLGSTLTLYIYDLSGTQRSQIVLNDDQANEYMYVNSMTTDSKGNVVLMTGDKILIYDATGTQIADMPVNSQDTNIQFSFVGKDDKLKMVSYNQDWTKMSLKVFNLQTKAFESDVELPGTLTNYGMNPGRNYDLMLTNSMGAFGFNIGDAEVTPILSYINSDIDGNNMNSIYEMNEGKLLAVYNDEEDWTTKIAVLTYVDPADIPDKEVISLACYYLDYNMRKRIVAFNKTSEKYRIAVKDYSAYSTADDYQAGYTQLNNDILSGQVPDIMIVDSYGMPVSSYIAKGVFADIGKMMEDDKDINLDDYLTNVFDAYSVDGKLYSVIPNFNVSTVIGKTSDVGEKQGWTMEDLKALMAKYPDASAFGETMTRENMLWQVMMYNGSRFVDATTGKCNFDTKEFASLLEFVSQSPKEYDWDNSDNSSYWNSYDSQYRDGRTLLMNITISDFRDYLYNAKGYFGAPTTLIGFPCEDGNGAVLQANNQYAIADKSKNKEGAWDFLKYYLTPEYQMSDEMSYSLPVYKEAVLKRLETAKERPYWENEDGTKEYYDNTFWIGEEEIPIDPLTDAEADMLYNYISSVNKPYYYDDNLSKIITEEAAAYFEGQKSVEEVTEIIQSRAQIYVNESR